MTESGGGLRSGPLKKKGILVSKHTLTPNWTIFFISSMLEIIQLFLKVFSKNIV
jgi:hypothetical protein